MQPQTLVNKIERLERRVDAIEQLPAKVASLESQILNLREDMLAEFSATRTEMRASDENLRDEIRAGDAETRGLMRLLHEDVISRFKIIEEGSAKRSRKKKG